MRVANRTREAARASDVLVIHAITRNSTSTLLVPVANRRADKTVMTVLRLVQIDAPSTHRRATWRRGRDIKHSVGVA